VWVAWECGGVAAELGEGVRGYRHCLGFHDKEIKEVEVERCCVGLTWS
jgi:hypothetical protein